MYIRGEGGSFRLCAALWCTRAVSATEPQWWQDLGYRDSRMGEGWICAVCYARGAFSFEACNSLFFLESPTNINAIVFAFVGKIFRVDWTGFGSQDIKNTNDKTTINVDYSISPLRTFEPFEMQIKKSHKSIALSNRKATLQINSVRIRNLRSFLFTARARKAEQTSRKCEMEKSMFDTNFPC